MRTLEDVAELIAVELRRTYPDTDWTVEVTQRRAGERPILYIYWYNLPHEGAVRDAMLRATDVLTTAERGFKVSHRHRFTRAVKSEAEAIIGREVNDFDFLTPSGFIDQDSKYYYHSPENVREVTVYGVRHALKDWNTTLSLVHRVCWLICDAQAERGSSNT